MTDVISFGDVTLVTYEEVMFRRPGEVGKWMTLVEEVYGGNLLARAPERTGRLKDAIFTSFQQVGPKQVQVDVGVDGEIAEGSMYAVFGNWPQSGAGRITSDQPPYLDDDGKWRYPMLAVGKEQHGEADYFARSVSPYYPSNWWLQAHYATVRRWPRALGGSVIEFGVDTF